MLHALLPLLLEFDLLETDAFAFEGILPLEPEVWPCIEPPLDMDETDKGVRTDCAEGDCFCEIKIITVVDDNRI